MRRAVPVFVLFVATVGFVYLWVSGYEKKKDGTRNPVRQTSLQIEHSQPSGFSPLIRVNVTPSSGVTVQIGVDGEYQVLPVESSRVIGRGKRLERASVTAAPSGIRIGKNLYPVSRLEIVPERSPSVWVGRHQYRGTLRLFRRSGGSIVAVNVLPLEDYIASVVDSEMPGKFPAAAREAQALVARTYALYQMQASANHPFFDVHATTRSQKYLGYQYRDQNNRRLAGESRNSRKIAGRTRGMVCTFQGRIFCTYYSAVCGGRTTAGKDVFSDAALPLKSVECRWCRDASRYRWRVDYAKSEVGSRLTQHFQSQGRPFATLQTILPTKDSAGTGIAEFDISDGRYRYRVSSKELRRILPSSKLYSPNFSIHVSAERLIIEGQGHGHGVGLCQWGARGLALSGRNAIQIIQYYYPGSNVVVMQMDR
jgi:stage II sporulation protein D